MKRSKIFLCFIFCLCSLFSFSQTNLVPNPSFEIYSSCPTQPGEIQKAIGWDSYANTPDYFNLCSSFGYSIPSNFFGYQSPASGNAYAGFLNYMSNAYAPGYREYIGAILSSTLIINTKYYVSFKVSLSINSLIPSNGSSDKMGAMFSTIPYNTNNPTPITNNPLIYYNSIITDSLNWTRVLGTFISDSAYQYIIIGNFF